MWYEVSAGLVSDEVVRVLEDALACVVENYQQDLHRLPTQAEIVATWEFAGCCSWICAPARPDVPFSLEDYTEKYTEENLCALFPGGSKSCLNST